MPREIRFSSPSSQVAGLTGRKRRTSITQKYADRRFGSVPTQQPTLAPQVPVRPPRVNFDSPIGDGPGIGPGEGAVGGIEAGSTFGETKGQQAVMDANDPFSTAADLFGVPGVRGGIAAGTAIGSGLNLSQIAQSFFSRALPLSVFQMVNKGVPKGAAWAKAAQELDNIVEGMPPGQQDSTIAAAIDAYANPTTAVTPTNQSLTSDINVAKGYQSLQNMQNEPATLIGMGVKGIKGLFSGSEGQQDSPQIAVDPSQTGGFDFGGQPHGSGSSPGLDAAAQQGIEGDPSMSMGQGGTMAGNDPGGGGDVDSSGGGGGNPTGRGDAPGPGGSPTALCTSLFRQGLMTEALYVADVNYAGQLDSDILSGYYVWARHIATAMDNSKILTFILKWPILTWAKHMGESPNWFGKFAEFIGFPICRLIAKKVN